jgi:hypothetical protein
VYICVLVERVGRFLELLIFTYTTIQIDFLFPSFTVLEDNRTEDSLPSPFLRLKAQWHKVSNKIVEVKLGSELRLGGDLSFTRLSSP